MVCRGRSCGRMLNGGMMYVALLGCRAFLVVCPARAIRACRRVVQERRAADATSTNSKARRKQATVTSGSMAATFVDLVTLLVVSIDDLLTVPGTPEASGTRPAAPRTAPVAEYSPTPEDCSTGELPWSPYSCSPSAEPHTGPAKGPSEVPFSSRSGCPGVRPCCFLSARCGATKFPPMPILCSTTTGAQPWPAKQGHGGGE